MTPHIFSLLQQLEQDKLTYPTPLWNVSWETGQFLHDFVLEKKPKVIVEVGTSNGFSALWLASAAATYGGELWTIESSVKRIPLARANFKESGLSNIHFIQGHAPEEFDQFPSNIEMVFLDGTKNEYLLHFNSLQPKFAKKAWVIADNTMSHADDLKEYLKHVRSLSKAHSSSLNIGAGLEITEYENKIF